MTIPSTAPGASRPEGAARPADLRERFRALHRPGEPFVLPNAWDCASAAALVAAGFPALGTTSLGVACAAGLPDAGAAREETLRPARSLARLPVPVTVDVEAGSGGGPQEVARLAARLDAAGVAGINIEDRRPDGTLADPAAQGELIRAVKDAAPHLFVNARTDTHWLPGHREQTGRRLAAYVAAGADGLFVPGLVEEGAIRSVAVEFPRPLTVLHLPGRTVPERLAELGVARISTGSLLFRAAVDRAVEVALAAARGADAPGAAGTTAYATALEWSAPYAP
ncbi:isocitrate lyase/phosphoenolpyruvate mutase family protein [Streptomyces desertarenae]|uniref:Isocitrate lyase/phosphoenolpyruvate mutase family protein n=1 Tax=Streptomyces desertarenae TaxID=2666184 RepID=A0ABW4PIX8_9ACTN